VSDKSVQRAWSRIAEHWAELGFDPFVNARRVLRETPYEHAHLDTLRRIEGRDQAEIAADLERVFASSEEAGWRLVKLLAENEPDRVDCFAQLGELERERRRLERAERIESLPPPAPGRLTLAAALERLEGVRRAGEGRWTALCPAHEDNSPSLVVEARRERPDEPHFHCYAGCTWRAVMEALKR
jgi:hypothetical protein